jgi:hypothetical protein
VQDRGGPHYTDGRATSHVAAGLCSAPASDRDSHRTSGAPLPPQRSREACSTVAVTYSTTVGVGRFVIRAIHEPGVGVPQWETL